MGLGVSEALKPMQGHPWTSTKEHHRLVMRIECKEGPAKLVEAARAIGLATGDQGTGTSLLPIGHFWVTSLTVRPTQRPEPSGENPNTDARALPQKPCSEYPVLDPLWLRKTKGHILKELSDPALESQ